MHINGYGKEDSCMLSGEFDAGEMEDDLSMFHENRLGRVELHLSQPNYLAMDLSRDS